MRVKRYVVSGHDGAQLSCLEVGDATSPGVLLLHALMGRASTWWREMRWLSEFTRVVALDQRGHGDTTVPTEDWSWEAFVEDARAVIKARRLAPAVVMGHSMGAFNAWSLAAAYPELVRALVIVDRSARASRNNHEWKQWTSTFPDSFPSLDAVREFFADEFPYATKAVTLHDDGYRLITPPDRVLAIREQWDERDGWPEYDSVRCPVLIVGGQHGMGAELGEEMARRLPRATYVEIPDAGHFVQHDAPEAFREVVEPFLRRHL